MPSTSARGSASRATPAIQQQASTAEYIYSSLDAYKANTPDRVRRDYWSRLSRRQLLRRRPLLPRRLQVPLQPHAKLRSPLRVAKRYRRPRRLGSRGSSPSHGHPACMEPPQPKPWSAEAMDGSLIASMKATFFRLFARTVPRNNSTLSRTPPSTRTLHRRRSFPQAVRQPAQCTRSRPISRLQSTCRQPSA